MAFFTAASRITILLVIALVGFTACKLWTVRPIESKSPAVATQAFNADSYVDSIWESKVVPTVIEKAVDLPTLLTALDANAEEAKKQYGIREGNGPTHFIVKGEGSISRADVNSPHRTVALKLPSYAGRTEVWLQIGPVFRGTALRDALGFIKFNQFVNQLQYAEVATKLHDRVFTSVIRGLDPALAQGKQVMFYGVFTFNEGNKIMITPVKLERGGKS